MNVHFIQHEIFEAPGAYLEWAKLRNYTISFSRVFENQPLPDAVGDIDLLIVMGGPQSPDTTKDECPHFDAKAEIALLQKAINNGKAVVGVCLGAQLIGEAFGAKVEKSPEKEIGVFPIQLTAQGLDDEKLNHLGSILNVGHWHSDMPGLTPQCSILANSKACPRQIIRYDQLVYGFQCHMEFNSSLIELLIAEDADFLSRNATLPFIQQPADIISVDYTEMNEKLVLFLDKLTEEYKRQSL